MKKVKGGFPVLVLLRDEGGLGGLGVLVVSAEEKNNSDQRTVSGS